MQKTICKLALKRLCGDFDFIFEKFIAQSVVYEIFPSIFHLFCKQDIIISSRFDKIIIKFYIL